MRRQDGGLRSIFHHNLGRPQWRWTAIETGSTASGVFDSWWGHESTRRHGWLECKKARGNTVEVRPHQIVWEYTTRACGAITRVAVWVPGLDPRDSFLLMLRGAALADLQAGGVHAAMTPDVLLGCWRGEPEAWPWTAVGEAMLAV